MKYTFRKKRLIWAATVLDAAGSVLFFRRRCPSSTIPAPKSFLVTRIDHLGDVLLSLPVAAELKKRYPQCRVVFLVSSAALALLKNNPDIDEVVLYDAPWFVRQRGSKNRSFFGLAQKLRAMRFDAALSLRGDLRENLLVFMAGIGLRIGYGITGGGFLLNREIAYDTMVPESKRIGALLKTLDIDPGPWRPKLYFDEAEKSEFESLWRAWGAQTSKKQVGLQMDAVVASRQWPAVYLKSFCDEFARRFSDARLVLIGSKALAHVPAGAVDLTGKTTIRQLCLLLGRLDSFVGLDSGPSHLAAALEVPTLCLYSGTTQFERWAPLGPSVRVFRNPVDCSPCALAECAVEGHPCMSGIRPTDVLDALEPILLQRSKP